MKPLRYCFALAGRRALGDVSMTNEHGLAIGDLVEVHTKFSDTWVGGFAIAAIVPHGFRVLRRSDTSLLPGYTSESDVRPSPAAEITSLL